MIDKSIFHSIFDLLFDLVAQLVEHLPFKERVLGSRPSQVTNAHVAELVDALG